MSSKSIRRIQKDIKLYHSSDINQHGIYVYFNEKNMYKARALIIGPKDTPYQNGFYLFDIQYPDCYPQKPPTVVLQTLNRSARFNPNLYTDGKVCLSILGTWSGPGWTPCLSTNEVLLSIQSLMNSNPIQNEPGYEKLTIENSKEARDYVEILKYHNHNIAVLQIIEKLPIAFEPFREIINKKFIEFYNENIEFLNTEMNKYLNFTGNIKLRMYNLLIKPDYQTITQRYRDNFKYISSKQKLQTEQPSISKIIWDETKGIDVGVNPEETKLITTKSKKSPMEQASDYELGHKLKSSNDNRDYIVKMVMGRGGTEHKRWILVK